MADSFLDWMLNTRPGSPESGLPANVRAYMQTAPSFVEGQNIPRGKDATGPSQAERDAFAQESAAWAGQIRPADQLEVALNRLRQRGSDYPNPVPDIGTSREVPRGTFWPVSDVQTQSAPVAAGSQSFAATVPPQSVSSFNQAVQQLGLTPQEQNLYQHHLSNLWGGGRVVQPGGDVSTVLQSVVQGPDGRFYNIPTVWNGQALPVDAAQRQAALAGWGNWPAYATPEAADARYMAMHGMMERDTAAWLAQNPNADPLTAMLMRQQQTQHPVLQMLEQLRQQQGQQ